MNTTESIKKGTSAHVTPQNPKGVEGRKVGNGSVERGTAATNFEITPKGHVTNSDSIRRGTEATNFPPKVSGGSETNDKAK